MVDKGVVMPTLDDVYCKFGEVSEAAQLVETELGTVLLFFGVVDEGLITPTLEVDGERATELLGRINRQTLGQLLKNTKRHTDALNQLEPLLSAALDERNRLGSVANLRLRRRECMIACNGFGGTAGDDRVQRQPFRAGGDPVGRPLVCGLPDQLPPTRGNDGRAWRRG